MARKETIYRVTFGNGETCHTGYGPLAEVWAKRSGAVLEEIGLEVPEKQLEPTNLLRLPASTTFTVEQALHAALQDDLEDVLIAGYASDGTLCVRSSRMTCAEALFLATKMARWAESGGQPQEQTDA